MAQKPKQMRPSNRHERADRIKVHLRLVRAGGRTYRVVTLRPTYRVRFSTNYYHDTWHILSDYRGARVLGRILWGLSYQRQPDTVFAICGEHIEPNPFDASPSTPVLLIPAHLTTIDATAFRALKQRLGGMPDKTIRWHSFGLDRELAGDVADSELAHPFWDARYKSLWRAERMLHRGGFICYTAPPQVMRSQAARVYRLGPGYRGMDYHYLAEYRSSRSPCWVEGEVQVFEDYRRRRSIAARARREVLDELADERANLAPDAVIHRIWQRGLDLEARRRPPAAPIE